MTYGLAVDLGTTFTAAAVCTGDIVEPVTIASHDTLVPSVVHRSDDGSWTFGVTALRRSETDPDGLARAFKRSLGDPVPLILSGEAVTVENLMARLLSWVVEQVVAQRGDHPHTVVVTHPAHWSSTQRNLLRSACESAVAPARLGLLTEPEAIAVHAAFQGRVPAGRLAVYDFGGGTFDATILESTADGFAVLGEPVGLSTAGGIDLDDLVFRWAIDQLEPGTIERLDAADPLVLDGLRRLRERAVTAKETLSEEAEAVIVVDLPVVRRQLRLLRSDFDALARPLVESTIEATTRAAKEAGLEVADLDLIVPAGGSSQLPLVSELIAARLGVPAETGMHPKLAVALGAAATLLPTPVPAPTPQPRPEPTPAPVVVPEPEPRRPDDQADDQVGPEPTPVPAPATEGRSRLGLALATTALIVIVAAAGWFTVGPGGGGDDSDDATDDTSATTAAPDEPEPLGPTATEAVESTSTTADTTVRDTVELLAPPSVSTVSPVIGFLNEALPVASQAGPFFFSDCRNRLDDLERSITIGVGFENLHREIDRYPSSAAPNYNAPGTATGAIDQRLRAGVDRIRTGYEQCFATAQVEPAGLQVIAAWASTHAFLCTSVGAAYGQLSLIGMACPPDTEMASCVELLQPRLEVFFGVANGGTAPDASAACLAAAEDDDLAFAELLDQAALP